MADLALEAASAALFGPANPIEGTSGSTTSALGKRQQLASWSGAVQAERWSALSTEARGEQLAEYWNGDKVIANPATPPSPVVDEGGFGQGIR
ncbi:MAG: hypothetical protein AB7G38_17135 [Dehalococcoidia bacterium]